MKKILLAMLAIIALAVPAMASADTGETAAIQADTAIKQAAPPQAEKRGIWGSIWYDIGALKGPQPGPTINASSILGDYNNESSVSHGVGLTIGKYFGLGFWYSIDALSAYNKKAGPGSVGNGRTWSSVSRQADRLSHLAEAAGYMSAAELRSSGRYTDLGRQTYGPKYGFDFWGVWPVFDHVSIYAGPGLFVEKSAVFFGVKDPLSNRADNGQAREDKTSLRLAGSVGVQVRPFGQLRDWTGAAWMDYLRGVLLTGGYHTERGVTFGAGIAF